METSAVLVPSFFECQFIVNLHKVLVQLICCAYVETESPLPLERASKYGIAFGLPRFRCKRLEEALYWTLIVEINQVLFLAEQFQSNLHCSETVADSRGFDVGS